ncbi:MAG: 3-deoxy-7-phosphoheptulonate synthase, partial [Simkaniaceae bacterium]|nr:3-deoxy-7-phosphoheptulonate synthase [Simkaniaceae bacterium]
SEVKKHLRASIQEMEFVSKMRKISKNILSGTDPRLLIVVGPCSIHHMDSAIDYARRLKELQERIKDHCFLIMRAYIEKPRSTIGWKGFCYDPRLDGSCDLKSGVISSRKLFLKLAAMEVPVATEFLDPLLAPYFEELITWGFIGARTSASQIHRQMASKLSMPIGFKNGMDGNLNLAVGGIIAANANQTFLGINDEGQITHYNTKGNSNTHLVLRGSMNRGNFDEKSIQEAIDLQNAMQIKSPILIDCSHGNSNKVPLNQKSAFFSVLKQKMAGNTSIMGMMLESHIQGESQPFFHQGQHTAKDISITDPCLDWESTKELILAAASIQEEYAACQV